jgi:hypothetical protein
MLNPNRDYWTGALAVGGVSSQTFMRMMEAQAEEAQKWWQQTQQATVIVLDNYSIHKSSEVKACDSCVSPDFVKAKI